MKNRKIPVWSIKAIMCCDLYDCPENKWYKKYNSLDQSLYMYCHFGGRRPEHAFWNGHGWFYA